MHGFLNSAELNGDILDLESRLIHVKVRWSRIRFKKRYGS